MSHDEPLVLLGGDGHAGRHVLCLAPAGAGSGFFTGWGTTAPVGTSVWCARLPGRESRFGEAAHDRPDAAIEEISRAVQSLPPGDLALFGYCLGAYLAHEVALRLADGPRSVAVVAVAGAEPLEAPTTVGPRQSELSDDELLEQLVDSGVAPAGTTPSSPLARILMAPLRADLLLAERYLRDARPSPVAVPILAVVGFGAVRIEPEQAVAWQRLTTADFDILTLVDRGPPGPTYAEQLVARLAKYPRPWPARGAAAEGGA